MNRPMRTILWALGIPAAVLVGPLAVARVDVSVRRQFPSTALVRAHEQYTTLLRRDALTDAGRRAPSTPGVHIVVTDTTTMARDMARELSAVADSLAPFIGTARFVGPVVFGVSSASWLHADEPREVSRPRRFGIQLPRRDGDPCVTLVDRRNWMLGTPGNPDMVDRRRAWALAQLTRTPCLLVGRFGRPSPTIAQELDARRWEPALRGDWWDAPSARSARRGEQRVALDPLVDMMSVTWSARSLLLPCAEGRATACRDAVMTMSPAGPSRWAPLFGTPEDRSPAGSGQLSGLVPSAQLRVPIVRADGTVSRDAVPDAPPLARLVADLARSLGPDRFARLWQTDQPLATAYAAVTGEPFEQFIMRWLGAPTTPARALRAAQMPWRDAAWVVAMVVTMLGVCAALASRREAS
jgi:hypothetical protein